MNIRRIVAALITAFALIGAAVAVHAPAAQASQAEDVWDAYPCYGEWWHSGVQRTVQTCPDWGPTNGPWGDKQIPVYDLNTLQVIGKIYAPGDDWYECQAQITWLDPYKYGAYYNDHWAHTMADNGRWGWVPEVFFRGGGNMDSDRKLRYCW